MRGASVAPPNFARRQTDTLGVIFTFPVNFGGFPATENMIIELF